MEETQPYLVPIFKKINEFERKYSRFKKEFGGNVYLTKYYESSSKLSKLLSSSKEIVDELKIDDVLKLYCQAVLDLTYFEENKLVDDDFQAKNVTDLIGQIISDLSHIEKLHADFSKQTLVETLGVELVECLHWRKGALLYMYCHTLQNDSKRRNQSEKLIWKYSQEGVMYLQRMLSLRNHDGGNQKNDVPSSDDTLSLVNQGIFGDTHMLAAMYAGEMCYWFWILGKSGSYVDSTSDDILHQFTKDIKKTTRSLLNLYISAADGPLCNMGWSTVKAKQILEEMSMKST